MLGISLSIFQYWLLSCVSYYIQTALLLKSEHTKYIRAVMKEDVGCLQISILHTVMHWVMVQDPSFTLERLA